MYPSTSEQIHTMEYIRPMEYYPSLEGNEVLTHTVAWMDLEDITQREISKA